MLELHVWGPAFGLPSFDAECLATIAFLSFAMSRDEFVVVNSSNPLLSPEQKLPLLRDGTTLISSFQNIVHYVKSLPSVHDINAELSPLQRAQSIAFSSLVTARATDLFDSAFYLNSENYTGAIRPLISSLLPFPVRYMLPQQLLAAAKDRQGVAPAHFDEDTSISITANPAEAVDVTTTAHLTTAPAGPGELSATKRATFRLEALAKDLYAPLLEQLQDKPFLISSEQDRPSEADCLAFGYLAICLFSDLPNNIVSESLRNKYPRLAAWVHKLRPALLGPLLEPDQIAKLEGPEPTRFSENGLQFAASRGERGDLVWLGRLVLSSLPFAGYFSKNQKVVEEEKDAAETPEEKERRIAMKKAQARRKWVNGLVLAAGLVGWIGYVIYGTDVQVVFVDGDEEDDENVRHSGHRDDDEEEEEEEDEEDEGEYHPDLSDEDNEGIEDQLVGVQYDGDDDDDDF
ncbi:hypothetical protein BJ508DRAFT_371900 [Ascobolus immersus RN42]|uniref:Mitochondrial outer membrane transport complex Sam37/metaxin N-terminal domain-containing protein n=1 Tax=Ascobolus immersus RN42 TaxID=1160509 RepID=A0A3N4INW1_ASCIM|nr:hypothetical protein BJ508DRAFT_371900 [Ascobolus immersus RN42]